MAIAASDEAQLGHDIHHRLLNGDPLASVDLCEHFLPRLTRRLGARFRTTDPELVHDAVVTALLDYATHPERFDPTRRSLAGYLFMAAQGDLLNLRQRHRQWIEGETPVDPVELETAARNTINETDDPLGERVAADDAAARLLAWASQVVRTDEERTALGLMLEGERATETFARALGLADLPVSTQRARVNAIKDRLTKRLRRLQRNDDE